MGGGMGGGIDTYILLTASGRWSHSLPTFKLMRCLRRRNHEWAEVWAEGWAEGLQTICTITMSVRG